MQCVHIIQRRRQGFSIIDYEKDVKIANIEPFIPAQSKNTNKKPNIWRITLEPGSDICVPLSIKFINRLSGIRYERMRSNHWVM